MRPTRYKFCCSVRFGSVCPVQQKASLNTIMFGLVLLLEPTRTFSQRDSGAVSTCSDVTQVNPEDSSEPVKFGRAGTYLLSGPFLLTSDDAAVQYGGSRHVKTKRARNERGVTLSEKSELLRHPPNRRARHGEHEPPMSKWINVTLCLAPNYIAVCGRIQKIFFFLI